MNRNSFFYLLSFIERDYNKKTILKIDNDLKYT